MLNAVGIRHRIVKTIGSIILLKAMAERMNLRAIVDTTIPMQRHSGFTHGQLVEALVMNRCHAPAPLYQVQEWANESGTADLYGLPAERFNDDRLRDTLDVSPAYEKDLQGLIAVRLLSDFAVPADEVLYDITSLYFEGGYEESALIRYGYSRDGKPDKKQVNLALTTSRQGGVPLQSQISLPGRRLPRCWTRSSKPTSTGRNCPIEAPAARAAIGPANGASPCSTKNLCPTSPRHCGRPANGDACAPRLSAATSTVSGPSSFALRASRAGMKRRASSAARTSRSPMCTQAR